MAEDTRAALVAKSFHLPPPSFGGRRSNTSLGGGELAFVWNLGVRNLSLHWVISGMPGPTRYHTTRPAFVEMGTIGNKLIMFCAQLC